MMAENLSVRRPRRWALLGAVALSLVAGSALAQGGPPPGGPPPGAPGPGGPGGPPGGPGGPPGGPGGGPPGPQLTPAQQLIKSLGPVNEGGDIVFPIAAPLADAPMPGADPRDIQGTWIHADPLQLFIARDMFNRLPPYTMKGAEVLARRIKADKAGKPYTNQSAKCRPPGSLWQLDLNMPFSVFQSKNWVEFVFEEYHGRWHIITNPEAVPASTGNAYMGRSVGHWDGSALVVETTGLKQPIWLDAAGTPLSTNGKLTQRIRKVDHGDGAPFLEVVTTIEDPLYYTKPWSVVRSFQWNPNLVVHKEYNCEEQLGDRSVDADAGLVPEPKE